MKGKLPLAVTLLAILIGMQSICVKTYSARKKYAHTQNEETLSSPFLRTNGSDLVLNGKPFQGEIGANHADLIWSFINENYTKDDNGTGVIDDAANCSKVLRFSATGLTTEFLEVWNKNNSGFWTRYDNIVETASKNNVYLIPVLIWTTWDINLGMFEPFNNFSRNVGILPPEEVDDKSRIFVPNSTVNKLFKQFLNEMITRYKDNITILMWEIGNELNLVCERAENYFNITGLQLFLQDITEFIRSLDSNHLIESGMSAPTKEAPQGETLDKAKNSFILFNQYVDVASIHTYWHYNEIDRDMCGDIYRISQEEYICLFANLSRINLTKPIIIGEFGEQGEEGATHAPDNSSFIFDVMNITRKHEIPLALIWEWEVPNGTRLDSNRRRWNINPVDTPNIVSAIPEFPTFLILPLFMIATLLAVIVYRRKRTR